MEMKIARQQHILSTKTILLASYFVVFSLNIRNGFADSRKRNNRKRRRVRKKSEHQHLAIKNAGILHTHLGILHIHILCVVYVPGVLQWHWLIFAAFNILKESVNRQRWQSKPNVQTNGNETEHKNGNEMIV